MSDYIVEEIETEIDALDRIQRRFRQGELENSYVEYRAGIFRQNLSLLQEYLRMADIQPEERQRGEDLLANFRVSLETLERALQRGARRKTRRRGRKRATRKRRRA